MALLDEARERGLELNIITYSAAISACEKGGQWERAVALLDEARERGLEPTIITYNAVMEALPPSEISKARQILVEGISNGYYQVRSLSHS